MRLDETSLHGSVSEPVMGSIDFLNEIMSRFPDAVSFAPGAPNLRFLHDLDVGHYIEVYLDRLCAVRGVSRERGRLFLHEYGPSRGLINDLIATALRKDIGINAPAEAVVVTVGAQEAMLLVLRALCRAGDLLAVVCPCYVGVLGAARLLDVDVVGINETAHGLDLEQLVVACREARAGGRKIRALYVAPDFANPSGTVLDLAVRRRLLEVAEEQDLVLMEDSAYSFTAAPDEQLPALKTLDQGTRVVYLGTFAKVCLPGARVGFVVADQTVVTRNGTSWALSRFLAAIKSMVTVNTSPICQAIIGGMLVEHGESFAELSREKSVAYRRSLAFLLDALQRHLRSDVGEPTHVSWVRPSGGIFVQMRLPVRADAELLERCAERYGVLWTPMAPFYLDGTGANELRLSCSYLDDDQIELGIARLAAFVRSPLGQGRRPVRTRTAEEERHV